MFNQLSLIRKDKAQKYAQERLKEAFESLIKELAKLEKCFEQVRSSALGKDIYSEHSSTEAYHDFVIELQASLPAFFQSFSEVKVALKSVDTVPPFKQEQLSRLVDFLQQINTSREDELNETNNLFDKNLDKTFPNIKILVGSLDYVVNHINDRDESKRRHDQTILAVFHSTKKNNEPLFSHGDESKKEIVTAIYEELSLLILSYCSNSDLARMASVNKQWAKITSADRFWEINETINNKKAYIQFIKDIKPLLSSSLLQYIVKSKPKDLNGLSKFMFDINLKKELKQKISQAKFWDTSHHYSMRWNLLNSGTSLALLSLGLVPYTETILSENNENRIKTLSILMETNIDKAVQLSPGISGLLKKIFTFEEACIVNADSNKLQPILSIKGLEVLEVLRVKKIPFINLIKLDRDIIDYLGQGYMNILSILNEDLITFDELTALNGKRFKSLASDAGLSVLRNKKISKEELLNMEEPLLRLCFRWDGIKLIDEKILSWEQLEQEANKLIKLGENGQDTTGINLFRALHEKLITWDKVCEMWDISKEESSSLAILMKLFSDEGMNILRRELITIDKAKKLYAQSEVGKNLLNNLLSQGGFEAYQILREEKTNTFSSSSPTFFRSRTEQPENNISTPGALFN